MATINNVKEFWERNLCLNSYLKSDYLSKEYFEESYNLRYKYHYHIPEALEKLKKAKPLAQVLEIGLGVGCDSQLFCEKDFILTGIDLTEKSVETTKARIEFYKYKAEIKEGNAEHLQFPDRTFDIVYSFGVLHHTTDTQKSIDEVYRVLKLNGIALIMLYNRNSLNYWVHKILRYPFDGSKKDPCPIERTYNQKEVKQLFSPFKIVNIKIDYLFGTGYKFVNKLIPLTIKKKIAKLMGWHLMIWATK